MAAGLSPQRPRSLRLVLRVWLKRMRRPGGLQEVRAGASRILRENQASANVRATCVTSMPTASRTISPT
jgi:hypothetical protein